MSFIQRSYHLGHYFLKDDGRFPNNEQLPVLVYKSVLKIPSFLPSFQIKRLFQHNGWGNTWKGGINSYHHYHSSTHELIGVYKGETLLLLGGDKGIAIGIEEGDVILIPAGVAHKNLGDEDQVTCIGAFHNGTNYDMNYGLDGERPRTDWNIKEVPLPQKDPVFGLQGKIRRYWNSCL